MLKPFRQLFLALPAAVALLLCLWAPTASAVVVRLPGGQFLGVTPHGGISPDSIPGSAAATPRSAAPNRFAAGGKLDLNPTPPTALTPPLVLHSSAPYLIFWDPEGLISARTRGLLARYFTDVAADSGKSSNVYGVDRQYYDNTGFADYRQTFSPAQALSDPQPYPAQDAGNCPHTSATFPTCVTDAQEQAELTRLIAADQLPSGTGANAPIYFVITPPSVNVCTAGGPSPDCADNVFCAYHSSFQDPGTGGQVLYAAIPLLIVGPGQNPKGCQFDRNPTVQTPNGDVADVLLTTVSHEDNETITDPTGTGWWDVNGGNEEADNCNGAGAFDPVNGNNPNAFLPVLGGDATAGTLYDQVISGHPYYVQSEWSNGDVNCELRPSAGTVTASFNSSPSSVQPGTPIQFEPAASSSTRGYSSSTWNFGDGSTPAFSPGAGPPRVTHTFSTAGSYVVTLTLVDTAGNLGAVSHRVTVGQPPTASFSSSPASAVAGVPVRFRASGASDHNPGGVLTRWFWSFGDGMVGTGASPSHAYASPGTYTATLVVADQYGLVSAPTARQVTVDEPPVARPVVGSARPRAGLPISFKGSSSRDRDGSIRSYHWRFGDGSGAFGAIATHVYAKPGRYLATLTVSDSAHVAATTRFVVSVSARITSVSARSRPKSLLLVSVNGPGLVEVGGQSLTLRRSGTARFALSLASAQRSTLSRRGKLVLTVTIQFTPATGSGETIRAKLTLRR